MLNRYTFSGSLEGYFGGGLPTYALEITFHISKSAYSEYVVTFLYCLYSV